MKVESIHWISEAGQEAEVEVSGGGITCWALSQPCTASVGDVLDDPLHIFGATNIMIAPHSTPGVWSRENGSLGRRVIATYADNSRRLFIVGGITLALEDYLPVGIDVGANVQFECARIDLW